MENPSTPIRCRRRSARIPLTVTLRVLTDDGPVPVVLRDVGVDKYSDEDCFGLGLIHKERLPLQQPMQCIRMDDNNATAEFTVTLFWTRHYRGNEYLSGGRMVRLGERPKEDFPSKGSADQLITDIHEVMA